MWHMLCTGAPPQNGCTSASIFDARYFHMTRLLRPWCSGLCLPVLLVIAAPVSAQLAGLAGTPLSVEARLFAGFPTGDFGEDDDLETGVGFGVEAAYNFLPALAVYAGFSRVSFGFDGVEDVNVIDSGFDLGLRYTLPAMGSLSPFLRGGLVYHELEFDADGGNFSTDRGLGFDIGGGIAIPLSPRFSLNPMINYVRYSPDIEDADDDFDVSYLGLGVSLAFRF